MSAGHGIAAAGGGQSSKVTANEAKGALALRGTIGLARPISKFLLRA
jgi:hypothetical protein